MYFVKTVFVRWWEVCVCVCVCVGGGGGLVGGEGVFVGW